ncbi:MAG: Clp protease [Actinomycetota bacterium]|nr:Clp protease [Actinomycetota bacterium]
MFERFTQDARAVVVQAQSQARRLGHGYVGCEHLLLAVSSDGTAAGAALREVGLTPGAVERALLDLVGTPDGAIDRAALAAIGIDLDLVQQRVEAVFGSDALARRPRRRRWRGRRSCPPGAGHLRFTPRAKRCLQNSLREALARQDRHIEVEHIALALLAMPDGVVPQILTAVGVSARQAHVAVQDSYRRAC